MKRLAAVVLLLLLLHGCASPFGLKFQEDCEGPDMRDSERLSCYHIAAVSEAQLTHGAISSSRLCILIDDIASRHRDDEIGTRAETERNLCMYDVVKATARFDEDAITLCRRVEQAEYSRQFSGAAVTQQMCEDYYWNQRDLASTVRDNENSLCNMAYAVAAITACALFFRRD